VRLRGDGRELAVGNAFDGEGGGVHVYTRRGEGGGGWGEAAILRVTSSVALGTSVDMDHSGTVIVAGDFGAHHEAGKPPRKRVWGVHL
jgi:hypothetical protein